MPKLPKLLESKLYKTGQTRGADDDQIFQNRVSRNSTVLIPYRNWEQCRHPSPTEKDYENGLIVLISPDDYFADAEAQKTLASAGLIIGQNALVFYETRSQWQRNNPDVLGWQPATSRNAPLGGQYVARIAATTAAEDSLKINRGYTASAMKGAGIRVYEYADLETIRRCRLQLEALFWFCRDADTVAAANGMEAEDLRLRRETILADSEQLGLLDMQRLQELRIVDKQGHTVCPLCLLDLSSQGFLDRMTQAEGRAVHDLTVTEINLFHIHELRLGVTNHKPYNLGWGHHHCNVVVRDSGIAETLDWMRGVVDRNINQGHLSDR